MECQEEQERLAQVMSWLQEQGIPPGTCVNQQLGHLWHTLQQREGSLASVTHDLESLCSRHAEEMAAVQRYLEHIRSLSEERDILGRQLEQENEELRGQLQRLLLQQDAQMNEVAEMLYQEGLAEVIPSSPSEQVAYLLVERASLLERPKEEPQGPPAAQGEAASASHVQVARPCHQGPTEMSDQIGAQSDPGLSVARECARLERDLEEASRRLAMAHKEIRRLTDELESARLTQRAYEPELQGAQQEVEQLRQEVEKLNKHDVAELRKAKELNDRLDQEIRVLRARVRFLVAETRAFQETVEKMKEDSDPGNGEAQTPALPPDLLAKGECLTRPQRFHLPLQTDPQELKPDTLDDSSSSGVQDQQLNEAQLQLQRRQAKYDTSIRATMDNQAEEQKKLRSENKKENRNLEDLLSMTREMEREYSELKSQKEEAERDHMLLKESLRANIEEDQRAFEELRQKMEVQLGEFREQHEELEDKQNRKEQLQLKTELVKEQQNSRDLRESLVKSTNTCSRLQQQINILTEWLTSVGAKMTSQPQRFRDVVEQFYQKRIGRADPSPLEEGEVEIEDGGVDMDHYLVVLRSQVKDCALEEGLMAHLQNVLRTIQQQLRHITEEKLSLLRDKARLEQDNDRVCAELVQEQQKNRDLKESLVQSTQHTKAMAKCHTPLKNKQPPQLDFSHGEKQGVALLSQESQSRNFEQSEADQQEIFPTETAEGDLRCDTSQRELEEHMHARQEECESLKQQLCDALTALDMHRSKYTIKQDQHKARLQRAKQAFVEETQWRDEKVKRLERELALAIDSSHKEKQLIERVCEENEKLLLEQRDLMKRLSDEEELKNNSVFAATASQRRVNFMEVENKKLEAKTLEMSNQTAMLHRALWNLHSLHSAEELKETLDFGSTLLTPSRTHSGKLGLVDMSGLLDIIHSGKNKHTKQATSLLSTLTLKSQGQPPEMGYLNLTSPQSCLDSSVLSETFKADNGEV